MAEELRVQRVEDSPLRLARIAGSLYLIVIVLGFFAVGFVPASTIVPGDPAVTSLIGEGSVCLTLLIAGVNVQRWVATPTPRAG